MNKKGFTLAEVMGVIILLGMLALVTIPAVEHYVQNSREKSYNSTLEELYKAARNWNMKYGASANWELLADSNISYYVLELSDLKKSEFLADAEIVDPRTKKNMSGCIYVSLDNNDTYNYEYDEECEGFNNG